MNSLINLITLQNLSGYRTQITIIVMGILNILNQLGVTHLTPEQLQGANVVLTTLLGYFFAEKVQKAVVK